MPLPDRRALYLASLVACFIAIAGVVAIVVVRHLPPQPAGNPDPGAQRLTSIEPVLSAVPAGAHVTQQDRIEPRWDSCDGVRSSYGWDPVVADVLFRTLMTQEQVVASVRAAMTRLGWTYDAKGSGGTAWEWTRRLYGQTATTMLSMSPDPQSWGIEADAPPALHPVAGC